MPVFFFSVRDADQGSLCDNRAEFPDRNAAWKQMTGICSEVIGDVSRKLVENAEWQMELLDETRKPAFRIRLIAETLD
jgi:hypothetical protein